MNQNYLWSFENTVEQKKKISITHFTLEKAMAPHSSTLAWKIPWTEEPGRLQSMGSRRVGQDWATSLSLFTFMHWRREVATHPSVLAWRIPGTGEPGGLPSMGSHRVGHDWSDLAAAAQFILNNKRVSVEESFPEILLIHKKFSRYKTRKKGVIQNVACGLAEGIREKMS